MQQLQQILLPLKGMDGNTDYSLVSPEKSVFIKNGQIQFNKNANNNGLDGSNELSVTPLQSNETDFDNALLPRIRKYKIDLSDLHALFPFTIFAYTKDYSETISQVKVNDITELGSYLASLGFLYDGAYMFSTTGATIWMRLLVQMSDGATTSYEFSLDGYGEYVGTNYCIGSYYHRTLNQMYWFNYNTSGRHHILMRDDRTLAYHKICETPILNFAYTEKIAHVDLIQVNTTEADVATERMMYWTDGINPPRKINIDKCLNNEYWFPLPLWYKTNDEWMRAVKYPPVNRIIPTAFKDNDISYNYTHSNNFQYRYRFLYDDGEYSVYSPISTLIYPQDTTNNITLAGNAIKLSNIDAGSNIVQKIELCFRIGNTEDFKTFDVIQRDKILSEANYNYDITNNTFTYNFYNNYAYSIVPQELSTKLYDVHPIRAKAQEKITNNTLAYGNILEGYNNLSESEINKTSINIKYHSNLGSLTLAVDDFAVTWSTFPAAFTSTWQIVREYNGGLSEDIIGQFIYGDNSLLPEFIATCYQFNKEDKFYFRLASVTPGTVLTVHEFIVFKGTYTLNMGLPCGTGDFEVMTIDTQTMAVGDKVKFGGVVSDTCSTWDVDKRWHATPNYGLQPHLKQGGKYQFGFVLHDEALRSTYIQTAEQLKLYVKTPMEFPPTTTEGRAQEITFYFNDCIFPDWVKYISIYRTKNNNINRENGLGFIQWKIDNVSFTTSNISFNINTLHTFNTDNLQQTTTTYTFTDGDIIRFLTIAANIPNKIIERQLKSLDSINFTIDYDSELASLSGSDIVEIYTPQQQRNTDLFYEISQLIPTTGEPNNNQATQGEVLLNTFDTYFLIRSAMSEYSPFESASRSDTIINSHGEDVGRVNVTNPTARQVWKPSLVRYSYALNSESYINGLSTFDTSRKKMYWRQYGGIMCIVCVKNEVHIIQEDNVFKSNIGKSQVQYANGSTALIASEQIISDPFDIIGDYGCQNAATVIEKDGFIYYWDLNRAVVVRYDGNKQEVISSLGESAYTKEISKILIRDINLGIEQISLIGGYCPKYNRYMITGYRNDPNGRVEDPHIEDSIKINTDGRFTIMWNMDKQNWEMFASYIPEYYCYMDGSQLGSLMVTFRYGVPYYHNKDSVTTYNTFYGYECNQVIEVVSNQYPQVIKNWVSTGYDSDYAYEVESITTSIKQISQIPIEAFVKKEGRWWSNFFRDIASSGSLLDGNQLKGSWVKLRLVKDRNSKTKYNELRRIFTNFTTSEKTLK